jgi:hypothetical protein
MYHFAVVALIGLAALKLTGVLKGFVPGLGKLHGLTPYVLAVAATVAMDYSVFDGFGIGVRETWMGTWGTGLIAGSFASVWATVLGYLGATDEEDTGHQEHGRPRMAA